MTSDPHEFLALDSRPWHVSDSHTSGQVKVLLLGRYQVGHWKDGFIDDIDDTWKRSIHLFIIPVRGELLDYGWELLYVDLMWRTKFNSELGVDRIESFEMERPEDLRKQRCIQIL